MASKDAPPSYEEAIAENNEMRKKYPLIPPTAPQGAPQTPPSNPYFPNYDASAAARPLSPPPVIHTHAYQQPQVVTVSMLPQTTTTRTVIVEKHSDVNHCLHFCITLLFWPWIFVWIFLCMVSE